jgi:hypothetical protein
LYQFSFPVTVPAQMPPYNIWTISLCLANGGCITSSDSSVIVTFPIPGFAIGEQHPDSVRRESSGAFATVVGSTFSLLLATVAFWLF